VFSVFFSFCGSRQEIPRARSLYFFDRKNFLKLTGILKKRLTATAKKAKKEWNVGFPSFCALFAFVVKIMWLKL
jgi:hypothetical protein